MLESLAPRGRVLLAVAAPAEARAALAGLSGPAELADQPWRPHAVGTRFDLLVTGIGKTNAAAAVARALDHQRHAAVLSVGIAGALPAGPAGTMLELGRVVLASACVYADEGLLGPDGFVDCAAMGFPLGPFSGAAVPTDPALTDLLRPLADAVGPVATVSTCSGLDRSAAEVAARTGAIAEGMEGAAIAHVAARLGLPCTEVRVISNTTGDRPRQRWDAKGALRRLSEVIGRL